MAKISECQCAAKDQQLLARLVTAAEAEGWPADIVRQNIGRIVAITFTHEGSTVSLADAHAKAVAAYKPVPLPGDNETFLPDVLIRSALESLRKEQKGQ